MQGVRLNDMDVMAKALQIKTKILKDPLISGGYDGKFLETLKNFTYGWEQKFKRRNNIFRRKK